MMLLRKPTPESIREFLDRQKQLDYTYAAVGATSGVPPSDFVVDHTRVRLGQGDAVLAAAKSAMESWRQFRLGWLEVWPDDAPIQQGGVVGILAKSLGLWWLNACRIVYVMDESSANRRFGFAYGTLPGHAESGEERFLIEMDGDETVWYDILAFSRPHSLLAKIGYPYVRRVQRRFGRQSATAMQEAVRLAMAVEPND